jgi:hypothetical protein
MEDPVDGFDGAAGCDGCAWSWKIRSTASTEPRGALRGGAYAIPFEGARIGDARRRAEEPDGSPADRRSDDERAPGGGFKALRDLLVDA